MLEEFKIAVSTEKNISMLHKRLLRIIWDLRTNTSFKTTLNIFLHNRIYVYYAQRLPNW